MNFRTVVEIAPSPVKITPADPLFFIGSCFAGNIGSIALRERFAATVNPMGVLYNPLSLCRAMEQALDDAPFSEEEIIRTGESWAALTLHSSFNAPDRRTLARNREEAIVKTRRGIGDAAFVFITLGTAWVYRHRERNLIASCCHKLPPAEFERFALTPEAVAEAFRGLFLRHPQLLQKTVILTVSPIRHPGDGATENNRSKAALLLAAALLEKEFPNVRYFPSYELLIDDLRDYRFYAEDMVHPAPSATEYIWERFRETFFSPEAERFRKETGAIVKGLNHRPSAPGSESHRKFVEGLKRKADALEKSYGRTLFSPEEFPL